MVLPFVGHGLLRATWQTSSIIKADIAAPVNIRESTSAKRAEVQLISNQKKKGLRQQY